MNTEEEVNIIENIAPTIVGHADLLTQTTNIVLITYTPSADGTFRVGGYIIATAISANIIIHK